MPSDANKRHSVLESDLNDSLFDQQTIRRLEQDLTAYISKLMDSLLHGEAAVRNHNASPNTKQSQKNPPAGHQQRNPQTMPNLSTGKTPPPPIAPSLPPPPGPDSPQDAGAEKHLSSRSPQNLTVGHQQRNLLTVPNLSPRKTPPPPMASSLPPPSGLDSLQDAGAEKHLSSRSPQNLTVGRQQRNLLTVPNLSPRKTPPPPMPATPPPNSLENAVGKNIPPPAPQKKLEKRSQKMVQSMPRQNFTPPPAPQRPLPALPPSATAVSLGLSRASARWSLLNGCQTLGVYGPQSRQEMLPGHLLLLHLQLKSAILHMEVKRSEAENSIPLPTHKQSAKKKAKEQKDKGVLPLNPLRPFTKASKRTVAELEADLFKLGKGKDAKHSSQSPQSQTLEQRQQAAVKPEDENVYEEPIVIGKERAQQSVLPGASSHSLEQRQQAAVKPEDENVYEEPIVIGKERAQQSVLPGASSHSLKQQQQAAVKPEDENVYEEPISSGPLTFSPLAASTPVQSRTQPSNRNAAATHKAEQQ